MSERDLFAYVFKLSTGSVSIPAGLTEIKVTWALDARRRKRRPLSLKSLRGVGVVSGEVKCGSTELHYYSSLRPSYSRRPTRLILAGGLPIQQEPRRMSASQGFGEVPRRAQARQRESLERARKAPSAGSKT